MWSSGATYSPPTCPMIKLLGSFCGQLASAMKPGTFAVGGTPYTPERSASRSRMPVAASALGSGFGAWALLGVATKAQNRTPQMASGFRFMFTPRLSIHGHSGQLERSHDIHTLVRRLHKERLLRCDNDTYKHFGK